MKSKYYLIIVGILVFGMVMILLSTVAFARATNVSTAGSLKDLLVKLETRIEQEPGFTFSIVIARPPNDKFVAPRIGEGDDEFRISEIGTDYRCLNTLAGQAVTETCIPYSNISNIDYLEN